MAMFSLTSAQVEKYLRSDEFNQFSKEVSRLLHVGDLFFGIEYFKVEEKFPLKDSLAFTHFWDNYTKFDRIYFLTSRIAIEAEQLYPTCKDGRKKEEILQVLVDFLLIHELTHLDQFKRGYNEELKELASLDRKQYKGNSLECGANMQAHRYLKVRNEFTENVSNHI